MAAPFILMTTALRRSLFVRLRPIWPAVGSAVYAGALLSLTFWLRYARGLSPLAGFLAMGVAAAAAAPILWAALNHDDPPVTRVAPVDEIAREHWRYGRWSLAAVLPVWLSGNVFYVLLPLQRGLEEAGVFRALVNLTMPMVHVFMALSMVLLPAMVRARGKGGATALRPVVARVAGLFVAGAGVYLAAVVLFGDRIILLLYGGQYSPPGREMLWVLGLAPVASGIVSAIATALRALERPDLVMVGHSVAASVAVVSGVILIGEMGSDGGLLALLTATASGAVGMLGAYGFARRGGLS
jgi:O-antigen/teichoic acid export membrane protein